MSLDKVSYQIDPSQNLSVLGHHRSCHIDAQQVQKKLKAMGKEYLKRNKIYAVSVGTPAEWKL